MVGFLSGSLVVARAAGVVVSDGVGGVGVPGAGLVESVLEDRLDAAVAGAADGDGALGGRLEACVAVALGQPLPRQERYACWGCRRASSTVMTRAAARRRWRAPERRDQ